MMAISRHHLAPLLVIVAALMFGSAIAQVCSTAVYELEQTPTNVNLNSTSLPIVIRSPNFPNNYPNNINYTLSIRSEFDVLLLVLYFRHFNVEFEDFCTWDALSLQGVKYCGTWLTGLVIPFSLPRLRSFTLDFKTDDVVPDSGFEIIVIPEKLYR